MASVWRWTVFSVFIISSHNNALVMCQNVSPNRPLPPAPILRESECSGGLVGLTPQQMNGFNYNLQRSLERGLERGLEINPQKQCLDCQRPQNFQDFRPEFVRPLESMNGRPCPLSVNTIQQSNLPTSCQAPLPTSPNTILTPLNVPKIQNNIVPFREPVLMNSQLLPQNAPQSRLEQGCPVPQPCYQDIFPQQGPGTPLQFNRIGPTSLPPGTQGQFNLPFANPNVSPSCEQNATPLLPQTSTNLPKVQLQEPFIPPYSTTPSSCPCSGLPNPNLENYPSSISPQCPAAPRSFNSLPPPKLLSPFPNLLPIPLPFNSLRNLPFGPGFVPSSSTNTLQSCPVQNPPDCLVENQGGNQISLPMQEVCPLPAKTLPTNQQSNAAVQLSQTTFMNGPNLQGYCPQNLSPLSLPSVTTNTVNNAVQNQNLPIFPMIPNSNPPPFVPPPNSLPPCSIKTDLSSIQFLPQPPCPQSNLRNNIRTPMYPVNIAPPIYQTTALPPVLPVPNVCDSPCPNPISEESTAPAPINLQINIPPPIITPPKIIIVAPSHPSPPAVVEEDANSPIEVFPPYPMPPIIIEGRRSRSKNWLPLFLVALFTRNGCCG